MILCAGEALIDMLPRQTEPGEAAFAPYPGGSVFNTAVALARLEQRVEFFSGLSNDLFGERLTGVLTANGVGHTLAHRSDRPTTLAFVTLTDGQASYAFYDENTAGRMLTDTDLPAIPQDVKACFFGGISLAVEPCADTYLTLAQRAAPDHLMMLDMNIRPSFISDRNRFDNRMEKLIGLSDIVKVSDEDLAFFLNLPEHDAVDIFYDAGVSILIITKGADGVSVHSRPSSMGPGNTVSHGLNLTVPAHRVDVVDTVGAGDTFNAAFLAGLNDAGVLSKNAVRQGLTQEALTSAVDLGVRAAAVTVSRAGANPPRRDEIA